MVLKREKPGIHFLLTGLLLQVMPFYTGAQEAPKRLETHPTALVSQEANRLTAAFRAEGKAFFLQLSGTGKLAHTINTEDPAIFLLENDSTVTLRSTSVQGYNDFDSVRTFSHDYKLSQADLEMLGRNKIKAVRKYSVMGFDEVSVDGVPAANLHAQTTYFLQVLDKENLLKKVVVTTPAFPGGEEVMLSFINHNLKQLPVLRGGEQKTAAVQFQVLPDGSLRDVQISQSAGPVFDNELLRIWTRMPRWKPGLADGDPIQQGVTRRVRFFQEADKVKATF